MSRITAIYTHEACLHHEPGPHQPESPARLQAALKALRVPEFTDLQWLQAPASVFFGS